MLLCLLGYSAEDKSEGSNYTSQGMTAYSTGEYQLAIESFKKAFMLRPENSAIVYNISCCYALLGEKDSAFVWLQKAIELGTYVFSDDEDLASLRTDARYQELEAMGEQKIAELKTREWKPVIKLPAGQTGDKPYPVVIGLHGFGTNPIDYAKSLESAVIDGGYILCCPYGTFIRGTTAFGWGECVDAEQRILEAVQYVTENYKVDHSRIVILGFSQGGEIAFCTGFKNPGVFSAIISVAGYYSEDLNEYLEQTELKNIPVYMMIGENDHSVESNKVGERLMKQKGIRAKLVIYPGVGHAFPPGANEELTKALHWIEGID